MIAVILTSTFNGDTAISTHVGLSTRGASGSPRCTKATVLSGSFVQMSYVEFRELHAFYEARVSGFCSVTIGEG